MFSFVQAWLMSKLHRDERGQDTAEYVVLMLGVVLFLLVAAFALQDVLSGPISKVSGLSLRVTSIFRHEGGVWRLVHRHADPITTTRPAESVIQQ